uniref:Ribosomal protein n=1 Tax=Culex pipiens TaxID=7175 RepID=A0A8D8P5D6_CULPI
MWNVLSRCRLLTSTPLLGSLASASRCTAASLFHVLAGSGAGTCPISPLANQSASSRTALLNQSPAQLLLPAAGPLLSQVCGFKVKGRLKRRCKDCYFVVRQQRLFVICKTHPRHKQMSMKKRDHNTWILTDATQSPVRAW